MNDQSYLLNQPTLLTSQSYISSAEPASGRWPEGSLDGPTIDLFGAPRFLASRSRSPAKTSEPMITGICGPTFFASSVPAGPLQSWESRLRARLAMLGSTECALTWKAKAMPSGRLKSRLVPSTRPIEDSGTSGSQWPTPTNSQQNIHGAAPETRVRPNGKCLADTIYTAQWPTPTVADIEGGRKTRSGERSDEMLLNGLMTSQWSTLRASDGEKGGPNMSFGAGGTPLSSQMAQSTWCTPKARDWKDSTGMAMKAVNPDGSERDRMDRLPSQMIHSGPTPSGSGAPTEKCGAPNPVFACWLMGWPDELTSGALQAIASFRKSPRKSSARS